MIEVGIQKTYEPDSEYINKCIISILKFEIGVIRFFHSFRVFREL